MRPLFDPAPQLFGKAHQLKRMKIREVSLVDEGANPGAEIILMKQRRSDGSEMIIRIDPLVPVGAEDLAKGIAGKPSLVHTPGPRQLRAGGKKRRKYMGRAGLYAKADTSEDATQIVARAFAHPAVGSETCAEWVSRVFGSLHGFDLRLASALYQLFGQAADVRTTATDRLEKMARARAAETGETFHKSYAQVCRTSAGEELYRLAKTKLLPAALPPSDIAKRAGDELDEIAKRIKSDEKCSDAQAFSRAAQRFPDLYAKSRGRVAVASEAPSADTLPPNADIDRAKANQELEAIAARIQAAEKVTPAKAFTLAASRNPLLYAQSFGRANTKAIDLERQQ